jgi:arabinofuranosyltransferase
MIALDTTPDTRPDGGRRRRPALPRTDRWLAAVPLLIVVVQGWQRRWMADDGFIHLRVVENVLHGHGFVFNAGERVEASTSALWVALLAVLRAPRLVGLETLAVVTGLACTAGGLFLATRGAELLWRREGGRFRLLPVGATILAVLPPMWDFATSGLETGLVFLWLSASFLLLARLTARPAPGWSQFRLVALLASAGPLIRPDLALFTGAILVTTLLLATRTAARSFRQLAIVAGIGVALPGAYQVFRMGYYGALVPNTALAKEATVSWWDQGWLYLTDLVRTYWLVVPLGVVLLLLAAGATNWFRARATGSLLVAATFVAAGLADVFYVTRVGGDFMHGRLLLPGLFAVLLPVAVVEVRGWWRTAAVTVLFGWALVCAVHLRVPYLVSPAGIADERAWYTTVAGHRNPVQVDAYDRSIGFADGEEARRLGQDERRLLGWRTDPTHPVYPTMPLRPGLPFPAAFAAHNLGVTSFFAGPSMHIVDPTGLADPLASRLRLNARGRPGHEKPLPLPWLIARFGDPAAPLPDGIAPPAVEAARRALQCEPLRELQAATSARLTIARFVRNVRLSIQLRNFRFPPDPSLAEAQLCRSSAQTSSWPTVPRRSPAKGTVAGEAVRTVINNGTLARRRPASSMTVSNGGSTRNR